MKLHSLFAIAALASGAAAQGADQRVIPFNGPLNYATYDLATQTYTITSPGGLNAATPDVCYDNACFANNQGFYQALGVTDTRLDAGRMPSTTSPAPAIGILNSYWVTQFKIAYVTNELDTTVGGPGAPITIKFWQDYDDAQSLAAAGAPQGAFVVNGPASTTGALVGWIVTVNVPAAAQFEMLADADGSYQGTLTNVGMPAFTLPSLTLDTFGYSYSARRKPPARRPACTAPVDLRRPSEPARSATVRTT
jgi:hypothetical protein